MLDKLKKLQYGLKVKWYEKTQQHTRVVEVNHRQVQIMEGGTGEPLLYLHSEAGENIWLPFHQKLSERFRVIAPAMPGYVQSDGFNEIDSMEDLVFHYLDLLDYLDLSAASMVGVSLGGWIAAEFATRYPQRVERLALAAPLGLWLDSVPMVDLFPLMRHPETLRPVLFHDQNFYLADVLLPAEPTPEQLTEAYKGMTVAARLSWNPPGHNPKLAGRLRRITSPTLILWGDDDKFVSSVYAAEWARHLADSRIVILKDCGHMIMFEGDEEFVKALGDFFTAD